MWKPNESLDDYRVMPSPVVLSKPPRAVSLRPTGKIEILEPLVRAQIPVKADSASGKASGLFVQPLWFRRVVFAGSAALVMIGLVLVSAILVGIDNPAERPDVAVNVNGDDMTEAAGPMALYDFPSPAAAPLTARGNIIRERVKRAAPKVNFRRTTYKTRQKARMLQRPRPPKFVPTTLVIYAENGVINTRIEPWLQAGTKKTATLNN